MRVITSEVTERDVHVNGVDLHLYEAGEGPLVLLCHGFPELGYSWRHQLPALAAAGYHAVAMDQRGYGKASAPEPVEAYDIVALTDDQAALLDLVGAERAAFVGHDWGANVVWGMAHRLPERVAAVVGMSVPFVPRPSGPPIEIMRSMFGDNFFYMVYFQEEAADADLGADASRTIRGMLLGMTPGSPDAAVPMFGPAEAGGFVDRLPQATLLPAWITDAELDHYIEEFSRTGFRGAINWYRNLDRNWSLSEPWAQRKVTCPAMFLAGAQDVVLMMTPPSIMDGWVTDLRETVMIEGAGHWVQQEKPAETNEALVRFLDTLDRW